MYRACCADKGDQLQIRKGPGTELTDLHLLDLLAEGCTISSAVLPGHAHFLRAFRHLGCS